MFGSTLTTCRVSYKNIGNSSWSFSVAKGKSDLWLVRLGKATIYVHETSAGGPHCKLSF